jgi:hypothetical protein
MPDELSPDEHYALPLEAICGIELPSVVLLEPVFGLDT